MLDSMHGVASRWLTAWLAACALFLSGCGGGGGDAGDGTGQIGVVPAGSTWDLRASVFVEGVFVDSIDLGEIGGAAIPSPETLAAAVASFAAQQYAQVLRGYTVSVNGSVIRLTDPDTDYVIRIDDFGYSDYLSCGSCAVGSTLSFRLDLELTEGGTLDGVRVPEFSVAVAVIYTFTRAS